MPTGRRQKQIVSSLSTIHRRVGVRLSTGLHVVGRADYAPTYRLTPVRIFMHRCARGERPHLPLVGRASCDPLLVISPPRYGRGA
jgi:hypothetical protein